MDWHWWLIAVMAAALSPWIGLIVVVVLHGQQAHRISALEEKMEALTGELGWKKE